MYLSYYLIFCDELFAHFVVNFEYHLLVEIINYTQCWISYHSKRHFFKILIRLTSKTYASSSKLR